LAAVPSIGRADRGVAPEAALTQALYQRHATQIFRYCLHRLGSREEAEDAVQSTFLNAFRGVKRGIVPDHESAWLFKIAENVCLSRRRSTWRRGRIESPTDFGVVEELAPAPSRLADELVGLQGVLEQMPESQCRAILLREWQGLSYREIAEELQLSQTAVETLIFRARRSLAKGLERPLPAVQKRRMARGADLGNLVTGLKSLLLGGGAAAAKVGAVVGVVSAGTVVAASPVQQHHHAHPARPAPAATHRHVAPAAPVSTVHPSQAAPAPASQPAAPRPAPVHTHHPMPAPAPVVDAASAASPVAPEPEAAAPPAPSIHNGRPPPGAGPGLAHGNGRRDSSPGKARRSQADDQSQAQPHAPPPGPGQVDPASPPPPSSDSPPANANAGGSDQGHGQGHHDGGAGHDH
jgi:RNA polymerase sigma factor (sigma-70 family)